MFGNVYRNRKVLVTGHTGFKGSWLACWLLELGARVIGYSQPPPTSPSNFAASSLDGKMISIIGDVRDVDGLTSVFLEHQPEAVFHLAAQPLVRLSYLQPRETFETNIMGVVNLLEAARRSESTRMVVNITSDKCYENREWAWGYRECDPMGGHDPYSSSKGCSELVTAAYRRSFFDSRRPEGRKTALATARAGNVIGGGDWADDRLIPDCVRALSAGREVVIRSPLSVRPWQHVLEPLSGYLWLGALMLKDGDSLSDGWNFGPELTDTLTVGQIADLFIQGWGNGSWISPEPGHPNPHEATYLRLDCSKAYHLLGWRPVLGIRDAVQRTVEWYREYYRGKGNMFEKNIDEIRSYAQLAREKGARWARI